MDRRGRRRVGVARAAPTGGICRPRPEPHRQFPGRSLGVPDPQDYKTVVDDPPHLHPGWSPCGGCWSGLCWLCTGSPRPGPKVGGTPLRGVGEGVTAGGKEGKQEEAGACWPHGGLLDTRLSLGRALSREFQDPPLECWGLSLGGRSLSETCGFPVREGGGPCWEALPGSLRIRA